MGGMGEETLMRTVRNTNQCYLEQIEEETRSLPRKHRRKRLYGLHHKWTPGKNYTYTVCSNTKSVRNYTCFQLFYIRRSGKVCPYLMQRESQVLLALDDFLTDNGSPLILQSNDARVMTRKIMKKNLRIERMQQALTEPKCQNQNRSERMLQIVKDLVCRLMSQHHCLPQCWFYALEMACDIIDHTSREGIHN